MLSRIILSQYLEILGGRVCKTKNDEVVEIAMSRQLSPALVAAYETKFVDKNLLRRLLNQWAEDWEKGKQLPAEQF